MKQPERLGLIYNCRSGVQGGGLIYNGRSGGGNISFACTRGVMSSINDQLTIYERSNNLV